jgi:hypothetical protein
VPFAYTKITDAIARVMIQTKPSVYSISQNAKLVLLERLKQELTSKVVVVDIAQKRKRKRVTTTCGGDDTLKENTSTANTNDNGASDASPLSDTVAKSIIRSRLIVGEYKYDSLIVLVRYRVLHIFWLATLPTLCLLTLMTTTNW